MCFLPVIVCFSETLVSSRTVLLFEQVMIFVSFFFKVYLVEGQSYRGNLPSAGSLPKWLHLPGLGHIEARSFFLVWHAESMGPSTCFIRPAFPRAIRKELDGIWSCQN